MEGSGIASSQNGQIWCFLILVGVFLSHPFRKKYALLQVIKLDHLPKSDRGENSKNLVVDQPPPSFDESFISLVFQPAELWSFQRSVFGVIGTFSRSVAGTPLDLDLEPMTHRFYKTFSKPFAGVKYMFPCFVCKIKIMQHKNKMKSVNLKQSVCPSLSQSPYSPSLSHKLAGPNWTSKLSAIFCPSYSLPKE